MKVTYRFMMMTPLAIAIACSSEQETRQVSQAPPTAVGVGPSSQVTTPSSATVHSKKIAHLIKEGIKKVDTARIRGIADKSKLSNKAVRIKEDGRIEVTINVTADTGKKEIQALEHLGASISDFYSIPDKGGQIQAWLPSDEIETVAELPWVGVIREPAYPEHNFEGIAAHNADFAQNPVPSPPAAPVLGAGVTVGVMSNGTAYCTAGAPDCIPGISQDSNRADAQALGGLPANTRGHQCAGSGLACTFSGDSCDPTPGPNFGRGANCECGPNDACVPCAAPAPPSPWVCDILPIHPGYGGGSEGTAMMEIVHDMAPEANIVFVASGGVPGFVNGINVLADAGVNIIVEDLRFDTEPAFDRGLVARGIEDLLAAHPNLTFHSSAGNRGQTHGPRAIAVGTGTGPDGNPSAGNNCSGVAPNNLVNLSLGAVAGPPNHVVPPGAIADNTLDVTYAPGGFYCADNTSQGCNPADCIGSGNCQCAGGDLCVAPYSRINLQWSEPRASALLPNGGAFTNLDLYLLDATGNTCVVPPSLDPQGDGDGDTLESLDVGGFIVTAGNINQVPGPNSHLKIAVNVRNAPAGLPEPMLDLRISNGTLRLGGPGDDYNAQMSSLDPNSNFAFGMAFNVGASGNAFQNNAGNELNEFSGSGPIHIGSSSVCPGGAYPCPAAGVPGGLCEGDLATVCTLTAATCPGPGCECGAAGVCLAGPIEPPMNVQPHIAFVGRDNITVTGAGGFPSPFWGTSASCPSTAGCDALVRSVFGANSSRDFIRQRLFDSPFDIDVFGNVNAADEHYMTGVGFLNCYEALDPPTALCQDVEVPADAVCQGTVTAAEVDDGSWDAQGAVAVQIDTTGPFPFTPPSPVELIAVDSDNLVSQEPCQAIITVVDQTPPEFVETSLDDVILSQCNYSSGPVLLDAPSAIDNCDAEGPVTVTGTVVASTNPDVPVPLSFIAGQTISLPMGEHTVEWTAADFSGNVTVTALVQTVIIGAAIQADNSFQVTDRAKILDLNDNPAAVLNSGTNAVSIGGAGTVVGEIVAGGGVSVAPDGSVFGDITAVGAINVSLAANHVGNEINVPSVDLPPMPTLPPFPPATGGDVWVNPNDTIPLAPGSYGSVGVNGNPVELAILILDSGDYFFQNLYLNSQGVVVAAQPDTRIFVSNNLTFNTSITTDTSRTQVAPVFLGIAGGGDASILAPFDGTLVAPNRQVYFGTGSGLTFTGSFYADSIVVTPDSVLRCAPTQSGPVPEPTCDDGIWNGDEEGVDCGGSCPNECPCNEATYEAESMPYTTGGSYPDGWNIWSNGYIYTNHDFTAGPARITVMALGEPAAWTWPHMLVTVGGVPANPAGGVSVASGSFQAYELTFDAVGGSQEIRVIFDNDYYNPPWGDRNLIIDKVIVDCGP